MRCLAFSAIIMWSSCFDFIISNCSPVKCFIYASAVSQMRQVSFSGFLLKLNFVKKCVYKFLWKLDVLSVLHHKGYALHWELYLDLNSWLHFDFLHNETYNVETLICDLLQALFFHQESYCGLQLYHVHQQQWYHFACVLRRCQNTAWYSECQLKHTLTHQFVT